MNIQGKTYVVSIDGEKDKIGAYGRANMNDQTIMIASNIHAQQQESTLLHEIIEVLLMHVNITAEHRVIDALEIGLYETLKDLGVDWSKVMKKALEEKCV